MKSIRLSTARISMVAAAVCILIAPATAFGEEDFDLTMEPIVLEVLESDVDTDSSKFQEYRDVSSGFRIPLMLIEGHGETTDRHLSIYGENVWRDDARLTASYGVWGRYAVELDYNKILHRFGNNGRILWDITGPGRLEIADPVQQQLQSAIEAAPTRDFELIESLLDPYLAAADFIDLGLTRDRTNGRIDFQPMQRFSWAVEYAHENRDGNRAFGGSFGFNNAQELPEPIDYETTDIGLMGEWTVDRSALQFGYRYSEFDNSIDTLIWDNPFRAVDSTDSRAYLGPTTTTNGPAMGIIDLAPNNEASTLFVSGKTRFADTWWASGKISSSTLQQDDPFQAYTLNTAIVGIDHITGATFDPTNPANLPAQRADLEADLLSIDADVGTDFGEDWKLKLSYDYYDYDASVPRLEFDGYVRMHGVWEEVPRVTVPFDYSRQSIGAKVTWDATRDARFSLDYEMKEWDRQNRETETSDEDIVTLTYDQRFNPKVDLRASWEIGDRSHGGYETEAQEVTFLEPAGINNQPGLRKYLQADREYDDYDVQVSVYPRDAVQLMFGLSGNDTDYPEGEFGLLRSELMSYNFEVSYAPSADLNVFLFANITEGESFLRSRQSGGSLSTNPDDDWEVTLEEDTDFFGLGLNARLADSWTADVTAQWSEADGFADFFTTPAGSPSSADDIANYDDSELFFVKVKCDYEISDRSRVGLWYWYEDYTLDAFLVAGLETYENGLIALDANFGSYQANVFGLQFSLDF